ncbi:MAG: fibronectin type III domain-containing protein, partial [Bacteroidales bacterium]|nr:fibronectin type III domain-containing protein [Bacteroidales bacterium]
MMLCFAFFGVARAQSELTVHDGTATNGYVPVYGFYADAYLKCEMVYPAAELAEMTGGTISSLTFYASQANVDWGTEFQVFVAEVDETTISDFAGPGTVVYEGALTISDNQMVVEFGSPYTYNGGNLLVGVYQTTTGSYLSSSWYGETVDGASVQGYSYSGLDAITATSRNFLPKTTFTYIPAGGSVCEKPATFEVTDITGYAATCTWESEVGNYTFEWKKASETDWTVVSGLTATTYQLDNLEPFTVYNTRVKAVCGTDSESGYKTANFTTLDVCPDGLVCIGEGTATNSYLPTYFFYNYSLTEQIYTADEIGTAGAIESVDIYSVGTGTRTLEIYMVSTEKRAFEGDDWIPATASDLVFSGEVTFAANSWNTFEFDNPFIYNGTSNVALIVRDMTGSYVNGIQFFVFEAESQALYAYRDASEYDLAAPGVTGTVLSVKNRVRFAIGEPPACPKPTGLAVNYEGGTSATFTWTENGTATSWDLQYSTDAEFNEYTSAQVDGTPSYELTGLELATTYYVRVNAFCEAPSEYSTTISFTTDACMPENKCALTFVVTDSYGDGWNGASIDIYDYTGETLGDLLASITNQNLDGLTSNTEETQTLTYNFCDGQELAFIWTSGSYDSEVSYTVTDLNGDVVVEGSGEGFDGFAYTMDCSVTDCRRPTDFAASEIANHSVVLSWTENGPATEWVIAYISENDTVVNYITVDTNPYTLTGLDPETMYAAQVTPVCEVEKPSEVIYWTTDVACPKPF